MALFYVSGKTSEGKYVISGCFKLYDTRGIPLSISLECLTKRGFIIDWYDFFSDAYKANHDIGKLLNEIKSILKDVLEGDDTYINEWENRAKIAILKIIKEAY